MLEKWTGEVKGRMHVAQISGKDLAAECGCSFSYLSEVLNGREAPESTKTRIFTALDTLERKQLEEHTKEAVARDEFTEGL